MKKLMIIVPNLQGGGQERIAALTSIILENDFDIFFLVFDGRNAKYKISNKAKFIDLNMPSSKGIVHKVINVIKRVKKVRDIRKIESIDYILSMGRTANIVNCFSRGQGKTIVSIRNSSILETGERNVINNLIYHNSDLVIFVSRGQQERTERVYPEIKGKTCVIYNPCDIEKITAIRENGINQVKNDHVITCCGRLESVKCYKNLFNSVKLVHDRISDVKLVVIGEGSQRAELEEYIHNNNMNDYIDLMGFQDNPFQYVARSGLFAFASAREGFPNVLIEALACGVPVISTDCEYGPGEILSGACSEETLFDYKVVRYGILVPAFQENQDDQKYKESVLAKAINCVLSDQKLSYDLQESGIKRAEFFSEINYKKRFIEIIYQK